jgi:hypothetical protein
MAQKVMQLEEKGFGPYHVGIAAEGFAAGLLAHAGFEVLVQYGANQPLFDLVAIKGEKTLKVSVKGTQEPGWMLTSGFKEGRTYAEAANAWLNKHGEDLVFIFVQFRSVPLGKMPYVYVARARDVACHLKAAKMGTGDTTLRWNHTWKSGLAKGCIDTVPNAWAFSEERIYSV